MKHFFKIAAAVFFSLLTFSSCDKETELGIQMMPDSDDMSVVSDSFHVRVESVMADSVFAVTDKLSLGVYDDPVYGKVQTDFLAELRYVNEEFPEGAVADSLNLVLYYKTFFGDSAAVQELTVYQMTAALDYNGDYYTGIDPLDFCDKSIVLGRKSYTPYDRTLSSAQYAAYGCNVVRVPVSDDLMTELRGNVAATQSQAAFLEVLKGVYVTNQYGGSCMLALDSVNLELSYHVMVQAEDGSEKKAQGVRIYPANREATQVVRVNRDPDSGVTVEDLSSVYQDSVVLVSTPAGCFPVVQIPFGRVYERLAVDGEDFSINHASLLVEVADVAYDGAYKVPDALMLIERKYMNAFFHQSLYPSSYSNALGVYSEEDKCYTFNNMGRYIESVLKKAAPDFSQVGDFVLVPVSGVSDVLGTNAVIRHNFNPSGAFYRSGSAASPMRLLVTYTKL